MKQLKFFKKGDCAIFPRRGTKASAGIDFFVPEPKRFDDVFLKEIRSTVSEKLDAADRDRFLSKVRSIEKEGDIAEFFWLHILWYNYILFNNNLTPELNYGAFEIPAGEHIVIPTGITANIPEGYCIVMLNKSGIATKKSLLLGAQLIDDYTGIIHIDVHNVSNDDVCISMGDKIAQGVIMESHCWDFELVNCKGDNDKGKTERGEGGFGSTGTK